jgi:predicted ferric reductase
VIIWGGLALALILPIALAATSPLMAWRDPVYIGAGFAGIAALAGLLMQPLLPAGLLPGVRGVHSRLLHRWIGAIITFAVILHVAGLWITSPPDVIDVLLLRSPTPFSVWGLVAMWALFAAGGLALFRRRLRLSPRNWQRLHTALAGVVVLGSIVHSLLIEGTMEVISKVLLCALILAATVAGLSRLKIWRR